MKILVVDDHQLIREALRSVLGELDSEATILEASNCHQAMQLIADHSDFDLVLLDLVLPDGDGFSVLAKSHEDDPSVPIVILSALEDRADIVKALDLGALAFIPKSGQREVML